MFALLLLMGITWAGGVNPIILDDDTNAAGGHAAGSPHTWAEIAAADVAGGWGQFTSNGTNVTSYRSRVSVQIGNSANTTTLTDATGSVVIFDATRTLTFGGSITARFLNLGTKIGTGITASGVRGGVLCFGAATTLSGTLKFYGASLRQTTGVLTWTTPGIGFGEAINTLFQSTAGGTAPFNFGSAGVNTIDNLYNCDFSHTTSAQVVSNLNAQTAERITIGAATPTSLLASGAASLIIKELALFGSATQSDLRWSAAGAQMWSLVRPRFSGNANKFSTASPGNPNLLAATAEYWRWGVKVVLGDGTGIANVPVRLTDSTGLVQVDTLTDANGDTNYTITLVDTITQESNIVLVADWYISSGTTVALRHRSPFLLEVNTGSNAILGYPQFRYLFNWTGKETVSNTSGSFEDMVDVISFGSPSGGPTVWTERVVP